MPLYRPELDFSLMISYEPVFKVIISLKVEHPDLMQRDISEMTRKDK
jgi:hypothetical protein